MKTLLAILLSTVLAAAQTQSAPPLQVWDGVAKFMEQGVAHVQGKPLEIRAFVIEYHQMGCTPKDGCPMGLWLFFYLQTGDPASGCARWFHYVLAKELKDVPKPNASPYPYIELVIDTSQQQIKTDEGFLVYPSGSVSCNGAMDWTKTLGAVPGQ